MADKKQPFHFWRFFFSPYGRVGRIAIWTFVLPIKLTLIGAGYIVKYMASVSQAPVSSITASPWFFASLTVGLTGFLLLWPMFAVTSKRLHDIGLTALFALPVFFPLIYAVAMAASIGFGIPVSYSLGNYIRYAAIAVGYYPTVLTLALAIIPGRKVSNRHGPGSQPAFSDLF